MKNSLLLSLLIACLLVACTDPAKQKQEAVYRSTKAQSAFLAKDYEKALVEADAVLQIDPDNAEILFLKSKAHSLLGNIEESINQITQFLKKKPDVHAAYAERALYYMQQKEYDKALADINYAVKASPKDKTFLEKKGLIEQNMEDHPAAIATFTQLINLDGTNSNAYFLRALSKRWNKDYKDAYADLEIASSIDGNKYDYNDQKGFLLIELGYPESAIDAFGLNINIATANKSAPLQSASYNNRANVYNSLKNYDAALADLDRAEKAFAENPYTYRSRALVYLAQNEGAKACEQLNKAKEMGFGEKHGAEVKDLISTNCQ